jgi:hypothetical protein
MRFREGDKVVVTWSGMVGVVQHQDGQHVHVRLQKRRLQGPDDAGYRYASVHEYDLIPHVWVRPGIGAVVGMVAAAEFGATRALGSASSCPNSPYGELSPHRCVYCDDEVVR